MKKSVLTGGRNMEEDYEGTNQELEEYPDEGEDLSNPVPVIEGENQELDEYSGEGEDFSNPMPAIYIPCPEGLKRKPDPECVKRADQKRTTCIYEASGLEPGDYRDYRVSKCNQEYDTNIQACPTYCM
jgi:hypothetical protein